ncbi:hypothetical protein FACS1894202_07630 [Clostridia bacterium]|nr:hypothetical protein FACS1894202_07630 [Clostridia bacterium]
MDTLNIKRFIPRKIKQGIKDLMGSYSNSTMEFLLQKYHDLGICFIESRVDMRLIRLEVLEYYSHPENYELLDEDGRTLLAKIRNEFGYGGRLRPDDLYYPPSKVEEYTPYSDCMVNGHILTLPFDKEKARTYMNGLWNEQTDGHPHQYVCPDKDSIDVPEGAVLLDIGAAEGFFAMKYLERCKKIYVFECDYTWQECLKKSFAPFKDKVEIVSGFAGDAPGNISIDDFFKNREKPTFVKMDVEGAEGSILRSMKNLLSNAEPLTLSICTYHRQEDWDRYYDMLKNNFDISHSDSYFWHMPDAEPPFFRRGVMRAVKKKELR